MNSDKVFPLDTDKGCKTALIDGGIHMNVICSYCRKYYSEIEPLDDDRISHGMCADCFAHFDRQLDGLPLNAYLDGFAVPVLIVNQDARIVALNQMAASRVGKSEQEVFGLLAGEVIECQYARLPGGCGKTVHCETCTLRIVINQTVKTRKTVKHAPIKVRQKDREINMMISVDHIDGLVRIVVDPEPA